MLSFDELTEARRHLQGFSLLHLPSLAAVQSGISFRLLPSEKKNLDDGELHHPSTTATCLSSIFDCPPRYRTGDFKRLELLRSSFSEAAFRRKDWTSEGSAGIYCRCRTLPSVIRFAEGFDDSIKKHIVEILGQLRKRPERFAIGEAGARLPEDQWYPPNAFHTYWTLEILDLVKAKFEVEYQRLSASKIGLSPKRDGMLLWARQQLGTQIALHSALPQSSVLDSDQLAWSLAIFLRFDETLNMDLENRDFLKQAIKCLFSTQTDGTWRHYKPLFHYRKAGNAYCYVFETFAVLLQCALQEKAEAEMVRELLKPYCNNLLDLWRYADSTKIPLSITSGGKEIGWCSGHRTNVTEPESWATASVFSYTQLLRRLIGIWCREEALASRKAPIPRRAPGDAANDLDDRGKTWGVAKAPVSERLWTLFVNPVKMHGEFTDKLEPDSQPIQKDQAGSAILFGPPGTSKTTIVRALADLVEWDYVEIHASHFVAEGLPEVQKTADKIFNQLSELDHAVVLFDEIDELVRERDMEEDAFGRFLTTSMLPKLAELWAARKILYFVATNHINYFDSAIIRSHRFDALILVSPPSIDAKLEELKRLLSNEYGLVVNFEVCEQQVEDALKKVASSAPARDNVDASSPGTVSQERALELYREQSLNPMFALAKFALLRWDELSELAFRLAGMLRDSSSDSKQISADNLRDALKNVSDFEWRKNKSYIDYFRDSNSERRDYQMLNIWEVRGVCEASVPGVRSASGSKWLAKTADYLTEIQIPGFELSPMPRGGVEIRAKTTGDQNN